MAYHWKVFLPRRDVNFEIVFRRRADHAKLTARVVVDDQSGCDDVSYYDGHIDDHAQSNFAV